MTITIDVDTAAAIKALDTLGRSVETRLRAVSHTAAVNIQREALGRVARRTGATARGITIDTGEEGNAFFVRAGRDPRPMVPVFLEFGTKYMRRREFFYVSIALEQGPHAQRIREAIHEAISEASR